MTQAAKHIWEFEQEELSDGYYYSVYNENGTRITDNRIGQKDALLVYAAPELLEALKAAEQFIKGTSGNGETDFRAGLLAVIAKAEGKYHG